MLGLIQYTIFRGEKITTMENLLQFVIDFMELTVILKE